MAARTQSDERRLITQLRVFIGQGKTDFEILEELNVTLQTLSKLKQRLFSDELEQTQGETAAENWVRYSLKQQQNLFELDDVIRTAEQDENTGALNARVGAIKAKADLIDRIFEKGQALGVIPKVAPADKTEYPTEIPSLQSMVDDKNRMLEDMAKRYGIFDYADLPTPRDPDSDLYFDD